MEYFSKRNKLINEYSGYQQVSPLLKKRLLAIVREYTTKSTIIGIGTQHRRSISIDDLEYELELKIGESNIYEIINNYQYHYIFSAIEILLKLGANKISDLRFNDLFADIRGAFDDSGSVYYLSDELTIQLKLDEDLIKKIEETKQILQEKKTSYETFLNAVSDFSKRKDTPGQFISNLYIATENFLEAITGITGKGLLSKAMAKLEEDKIITNTQKKASLTAIEGYASSAKNVRHSGSNPKPDELDAFWFLETVINLIKLIDGKLKQKAT